MLADSDQRAARAVALALLRDCVAAQERLPDAGDAEALHDFRVAVRRLRSWLRAFRDTLNEKPIGRAERGLARVARLTGTHRDSEVFVEWLNALQQTLSARERVGAAWLLDREKTDAVGVAANDPASLVFAGARDVLETRLPLFRVMHHVDGGPRQTSFAAGMARQLRTHLNVLTRRLARVGSVTDSDAAHRARIAGKRLRYLLEPVVDHLPQGSEAIHRLKALQDVLGDLHDAHVWLLSLGSAFEEAARDEARHVAAFARADVAIEPRAGAVPRPDPNPGLMATTARARERALASYQTFEASWGVAAADRAAFDAIIDTAASELERRAGVGVEIERKYLLCGLPDNWPEAESLFVEQGYLPGDRLVERLRRTRTQRGEALFRTVKVGVGIQRIELEEETTREVFDTMWPLTAGRRLTKRRHRIPVNGLVWEIDEFTDRDLVLAEVELLDALQEPMIPDWLAPFVVRDVTGEPEYVNVNLAR